MIVYLCILGYSNLLKSVSNIDTSKLVVVVVDIYQTRYTLDRYKYISIPLPNALMKVKR